MDEEVCAEIFSALRWGESLWSVETASEQQLRPFLPCLTRMTLCPELVPGLSSEAHALLRRKLLGFDSVNSLVRLMNADFAQIDADLRKELAIK